MSFEQHRDFRYSAPRDLRVPGEPFLRRAILIGSCATGMMPQVVQGMPDSCPLDFFNVNHGCHLPDPPPAPIAEYDFQLIQIPIRVLFPDRNWMRIEPGDEAAAAELLDLACTVLELSLDNALLWTRQTGVPAFVMNFLTPQQNPHGRFMPRYVLSNPVHFIERLNHRLYDLVQSRKDAYLLDIDQVSAMFGRKTCQDDAVTLFSHAATVSDFDASHDGHRIEPVPPMTEQYGIRTDQFLGAVWEEAVAMHRTLRQVDAVKAVVADLDDTLWRGILAEADAGSIDYTASEGWPIGFAESLLYLKKRGILLAIASRNDPDRAKELWNEVYGDRIQLSDFASVQIGWQPKAESIARILGDFTILPRNVVFIDDNPVERAAIQQAFPGIRVLGANPYHLRRIMLWAPELQQPVATAESRRRTEMVQAQATREAARAQMTHEAFLSSLSPKVTVFDVFDDDGPRFARTFELLNKTNQFNTTGRRWDRPGIAGMLAAQGRIFAFEVTDAYTRYGLVGVVLVQDSHIVQFVMSCRVLGLEAEIGVLAALLGPVVALPVTAALIATDANMPVRDLWSRAGFEVEGDGFVLRDPARLACPSHLTVESDIVARPADPATREPEETVPPPPLPEPTLAEAAPLAGLGVLLDSREPPPAPHPVTPNADFRRRTLVVSLVLLIALALLDRFALHIWSG